MATDVPKTKDSRFFLFLPHDSASTTARFSLNDRTIQPPTTARTGTGLSFPHREAASGKDKMLFPISDVGYQPAFHASFSNDR